MPSDWRPVVDKIVTSGIRPIFGAGPVDALMNTMTVVRSFFHSFHGLDE